MITLNEGIVGKRTSEVVAVYLSPEQKKLLEQWAEKERRSVSNLAANILIDALETKFSDRANTKSK